jgi:hypothetical protein
MWKYNFKFFHCRKYVPLYTWTTNTKNTSFLKFRSISNDKIILRFSERSLKQRGHKR